MAAILMPLPNNDFDPTEAGVPWRVLRDRGHRIVFATPDGKPGEADPRMVTGEGLGIFAPLLKADGNGRRAYDAMTQGAEFQHPIVYDEIRPAEFDAVLLPGGHAKGMRPYLESGQLQSVVVEFFAKHKVVGAICHGVVLAARSRVAERSVLYGRKTTGLTKLMELSAWGLTCVYLGDYYRTYRTTVEDEVRAALAQREDFLTGPVALTRDSPGNPQTGFIVRDDNYLSARWPGDAHRFADDFASMVERPNA
jgi:protease I